MGRIYKAAFQSLAVGTSGVLEFFTLYSGATKIIRVHSIELGQDTQTGVDNLLYSIHRLPATVTPGTGGTSLVFNPVNPNDTAATITGKYGNTGATTTGGTAQLVQAGALNIINGYLDLPPDAHRLLCDLSQAWVMKLDSLPTESTTFSGSITVEEVN